MSARELVEKWRNLAEASDGKSYAAYRELAAALIAESCAFSRCADELEAALLAVEGECEALREAARIGLQRLESDIAGLLESHCLLDDDHNPRLDTLDDEDREFIAPYQEDAAKIRAALGEVR